MRRTVLLAACLLSASAYASGDIEGTAELSKEIAARVAPGGTAYIFVRELGRESGPPAAVRSIPNPSYPLKFTLRPQDQMVPGSAAHEFRGRYKLYVRHSPRSLPMTDDGFLGTSLGFDGRGVTAGSAARVVIDTALH